MKCLTEKEVSQVWQRQLLDRAGLATEDGQALKVIYPGRRNDDRGADFRDAVITRGRETVKGDIEVHVRSSDWQQHGHQRDASYNRVILHAVMWHDQEGGTILQSGRQAPVLAMGKYLGTAKRGEAHEGPSRLASDAPCRSAGQRAYEGLVAFLDRSGEARFAEKAARFQTELSQIEAGQVLYQGIMEALGYAKNKAPFSDLARRLPLRALEGVTRSRLAEGGCLSALQARLLGTAGLLPGSQHDNPMPPHSWNTFKVRPQNSPYRRLTAMSYLLLRYRKRGILEELAGRIAEARGRQEYATLERALVVTTAGGIGRSMTLLGRGRAADIAINVLLPFGIAWGRVAGRPELAQRSLYLCRHYPRRMANSIERHMSRQLGLDPGLVDSALRQQGLIHIYKSLCTEGLCQRCRLAQLQSRNDIQS